MTQFVDQFLDRHNNRLCSSLLLFKERMSDIPLKESYLRLNLAYNLKIIIAHGMICVCLEPTK